MQYRKIYETNQYTAVDNAGLENGDQNCRGGKCENRKCETKTAGVY